MSYNICFHIYYLIEHCTMHVRRPLDENKTCCFFLSDTTYVPPAKLYTRNYLIMVETYIFEFRKKLYYRNKRLAFHLTHVLIIGTYQCGNTHYEALNVVDIFNFCFVFVNMPRQL